MSPVFTTFFKSLAFPQLFLYLSYNMKKIPFSVPTICNKSHVDILKNMRPWELVENGSLNRNIPYFCHLSSFWDRSIRPERWKGWFSEKKCFPCLFFSSSNHFPTRKNKNQCSATSTYGHVVKQTLSKYTYCFKTIRTHCFASKIWTVQTIYLKFPGSHIPSMHGIPYQFQQHIVKKMWKCEHFEKKW